jgi:hypothetical protein
MFNYYLILKLIIQKDLMYNTYIRSEHLNFYVTTN